MDAAIEIARILLERQIERLRAAAGESRQTIPQQRPNQTSETPAGLRKRSHLVTDNNSTMIVFKTPAEILGIVYNSGGWFEVQDEILFVKGLDTLSDELRELIKAHRSIIHKYVSAFPGERWPNQPRSGL